MREALNAIARLLTNGTCDAMTLNWAALRYPHTAVVRSVLMERYSPAMANKMLCALRRTLKEAWRLEQMSAEDYDRAVDIESIQGTSLLRGRALSGEEIAALMDACTLDLTLVGVRDAAMLAILMVGLRRSEVVNLDLKDFNPRTRALTIRGAKGRKDRIVYLPVGSFRAVKDWLAVRGKEPGPLLYPLNKAKCLIPRRMSEQAVTKALHRRGKEAEVDYFSPHDLRRTFISNLLDAGADLVTASELAGHSSTSVTARYDRRGEETKKKAIDLLNVPYSKRNSRSRN
jgi:integrase